MDHEDHMDPDSGPVDLLPIAFKTCCFRRTRSSGGFWVQTVKRFLQEHQSSEAGPVRVLLPSVGGEFPAEGFL